MVKVLKGSMLCLILAQLVSQSAIAGPRIKAVVQPALSPTVFKSSGSIAAPAVVPACPATVSYSGKLPQPDPVPGWVVAPGSAIPPLAAGTYPKPGDKIVQIDTGGFRYCTYTPIQYQGGLKFKLP